ncbi:hypothetical protein AFUB_096460 [Aspergillus fumigatus A1163]|uniref:Uncharacterized protein n=1 Tax=Aspergillus fumigatus (strain CBS 144.89 / FGSC A1163 / CEA10) TaxID=451804 RepID=B0YDR0_ASPFC|nr:hypothetical protein AFUB_096460 [Aspergillus fumigatus A1163]
MSAWWAYTTARAGEERDKQRERDKQSASAQMDLWTEEIAWQHSVLMLLVCVCELTENPLCPDYSVQGSERKYLKLGSSGRKVVLFLSCSGSTGVVGYMGAIWLLCLDRDRGLIFMTVAEADKKQFYFFFFFFFVLQNDLVAKVDLRTRFLLCSGLAVGSLARRKSLVLAVLLVSIMSVLLLRRLLGSRLPLR